MTENLPKLVQHQTTDPGNPKNAKQNKCQKTTSGHITFTL